MRKLPAAAGFVTIRLVESVLDEEAYTFLPVKRGTYRQYLQRRVNASGDKSPDAAAKRGAALFGKDGFDIVRVSSNNQIVGRYDPAAA